MKVVRTDYFLSRIRHHKILMWLLIALLIICVLINLFTNEGPTKIEPPLKWHQLSDGSLLSDPLIGSDFQVISRCWKIKSQFDCLSIFKNPGDISVSRFHSKVPKRDLNGTEDGYSCSYWPGYFSENLDRYNYDSKSKDTLKHNTISLSYLNSYGNEFWRKKYVNDYIIENNINDNNHFDCSFIVQLVNEGSYLSVSTSDLTYQMMIGSEK